MSIDKPESSNSNSIDTPLLVLIIGISSLIGAFGGSYLSKSHVDNSINELKANIPKIVVFDPGKYQNLDPDDQNQIHQLTKKVRKQSTELAEKGVITLWGHTVVNAPSDLYYKEEP
jgi:hypothetical protein